MAIPMEPCPRCGSVAHMVPFDGGRGTGETTSYAGECFSCGHRVDHLPSSTNGRKDSAIREWNRLARASRTQEPT